MRRHTRGHRSGFTLVELLVALALIIFIMTILSQAFVAASGSFRDLKAAGDLARSQRAALNLLRDDLAADHVDGKRRLSDPDFWAEGPPREGFFRIYQTSLPVVDGPVDDGVVIHRSTGFALHFTVRAKGNARQDFYSSALPPGPPPSPLLALFAPSAEARYQDSPDTFRSQWAEVVWFLAPSADAAGIQDTANGTPLYGLFRRQYGVLPTNEAANALNLTGVSAAYGEMSSYADPATGAEYFNTPISLTMPVRRMEMVRGTPQPPPANPPVGDQDGALAGVHPTAQYTPIANPPNMVTSDLVVTDVISFDVQVLAEVPPTPLDPNPPLIFRHLHDPAFQRFATGNPVYPGTRFPLVFDTWSQARDELHDYTKWTPVPGNPNPPASMIPLWWPQQDTGPIIRALRISLRIWDPKTELTRQTTIVLAM